MSTTAEKIREAVNAPRWVDRDSEFLTPGTIATDLDGSLFVIVAIYPAVGAVDYVVTELDLSDIHVFNNEYVYDACWRVLR